MASGGEISTPPTPPPPPTTTTKNRSHRQHNKRTRKQTNKQKERGVRACMLVSNCYLWGGCEDEECARESALRFVAAPATRGVRHVQQRHNRKRLDCPHRRAGGAGEANTRASRRTGAWAGRRTGAWASGREGVSSGRKAERGRVIVSVGAVCVCVAVCDRSCATCVE